METKELTESEIQLVACWNVQLHEDEASKPMAIEQAEERLRGWLRAGKFKGAIFQVNGTPIGYVLYGYRKEQSDSRETESIYIRQFFISRKSRRKGYGTAAFQLVLEEFVPHNSKVKLNVKSSNPSGQRFWESLGFKPENIEYDLYRP